MPTSSGSKSSYSSRLCRPSFFLPFLRPLGSWCIRTEELALFTEARRSWILRTSPVRSSWIRSAQGPVTIVSTIA
jgi:hypothetical protein